VQAVVVNAGIANAATGKTGMDLCSATAEYTGKAFGIPAGSVLLGSTGVIGPNIPIDKITAGVSMMKETLSGTLEAGTAASKAIMTTDTVNKEFAVEFDLPAADGCGTVTVRLGGMSKGSGMIHPDMCTMLGYITTDCAISKELLTKALRSVVPDTFNMITVDGDTSTNDTLLVLADGLAGNRPVSEEDGSYALFREALESVCHDLAVLMASDGEGATHLLEMRVYHADTKENARILAKSVVGSSLVKAMIFGRDANCGRILCALGYAGPDFDPAVIELYLIGAKETLCFYKDGYVQPFDEEKAAAILGEKEVRFACDMKMGEAEATAWGCDLTHEYVTINGDYRS
jgi:glutamate N-acetyltransferase/amino-acid N-acetyltransferase